MTRRKLLWAGVVLLVLLTALAVVAWTCLVENDSLRYRWIERGMTIRQVLDTLKVDEDFHDVGVGGGEDGDFVYYLYATRGTLVIYGSKDNRVIDWHFREIKNLPMRSPLARLRALLGW